MTYPAKITKALHEVMGKVSYVQKGQYNKFHKYNYAGEADLLAVLRPALMEAGLLLIPSAVSQSPIDSYGNTQVIMEYTLAHKDGDVWPDKIKALGCGSDKNSNGVGDKGTYKAITGANKYLLFKLFQIETGDDPETEGAHDASTIQPMGNGKHRDDIGARESWEEWAKGQGKESNAAQWLQSAANAIRELVNIEDLNRWQALADNRKRIDALREHHPQRYDWLMIKIEDKRESLNAKAA